MDHKAHLLPDGRYVLASRPRATVGALVTRPVDDGLRQVVPRTAVARAVLILTLCNRGFRT